MEREREASAISAAGGEVGEGYPAGDYRFVETEASMAVTAAEEVADGRVRVPKGKRRVAAGKGRARAGTEQDDLSAADFQ